MDQIISIGNYILLKMKNSVETEYKINNNMNNTHYI